MFVVVVEEKIKEMLDLILKEIKEYEFELKNDDFRLEYLSNIEKNHSKTLRDIFEKLIDAS